MHLKCTGGGFPGWGAVRGRRCVKELGEESGDSLQNVGLGSVEGWVFFVGGEGLLDFGDTIGIHRGGAGGS